MRSFLFCLFFVFSLLVGRSAQAETIVVTKLVDTNGTCTPSDCSLREAINRSNASSDNTITFQSGLSGTITLSGTELLVQKSLTIQGPGSGTVTVSGNNVSRVFHFLPASSTSPITGAVSGLTITEGNSDMGGGLYNEANSSLTLSRCVITGNTANLGGGGIHQSGTLTLIECTIAGNTATGQAGGILQTVGTSTLIGSTLSDNTSTPEGSGAYGGAIYLSSSTMSLSGCTLNGNISQWGGAICQFAGALSVSNSTLVGNSSVGGGAGGAIFEYGGTLGITSSTIVGNSSSTGGGIAGSGQLLSNTIVAGNSATGTNPQSDISGTFTSGDYNLVQNLTGATLPGTHNITGVSPRLSELAQNGGPTATLLPLEGSLAINAGAPAFDASGTPYDQRGAGFARVRGGRVDIGAVELAAPPTNGVKGVVTSLADDYTAGTLRGEIARAETGDTITFQSGLSGTITLNGAQLLVQKSLTIQGPGSGTVTVSGNNASRVFHFLPATGTTMQVAVSGLTMTGGNGNSTRMNFSPSGGGLVNAPNSALTLSQCVITGNTAGTDGGGTGGGIAQSGTLTLIESTLSGNTSANGGGIYQSTGTSTLVDSTLSGNTSTSSITGANGGAIYLSNGTLSLSGCTLNNNKSLSSYPYDSIYGGAINQSGGTLSITNSTLVGNSTTGSGGALHRAYGTLSVVSSTIFGNTASTAGGGLSGGAQMLSNSIVAGNSAPSSPNISGTFNTGDYNLVQDSTGGTLSGTHNRSGDPQLSGLNDNGGPTQTMAPTLGSPVIDSGDPAYNATSTPYDQRGAGYARVLNGRVDIGAFEGAVPPSSFSIAEVSQSEGNSSSADFTFTVTLSIPSNQTTTVSYATSNGTATNSATAGHYSSGGDYTATSGTLTFAPGTRSQSFTVSVWGDTTIEPDETFAVSLSGATNAAIADGEALGTIADDDLDKVKPAVTIATPLADQKMLISQFKAGSITGTASDAFGVVSVGIRLSRLRGGVVQVWNGSAFVSSAAPIPATLSGSPTQVNWGLIKQLPPASQLDEGQYIIVAYATDAQGNIGSTTRRVTLYGADTEIPLAQVFSPTLNQKMLLANFKAGTVTGNALDNIGVNSVRVRLSRKRGNVNQYWNGTAFTTSGVFLSATLTAVGATSPKWNLDSQMPPLAALDSGLYQLEAYAVDIAGNKSATIVRPFTLGTDFTAPSVAITAPTQNQKLALSAFGAGSVNGIAGDNLGVVSVKLKLQRKRGTVTTYWNGTAFTSVVATVDATLTSLGGTSVNWSLSGVPTPAQGLDAGAYTLYAASYDAAGNTRSSASRGFTLSGTATSGASQSGASQSDSPNGAGSSPAASAGRS